jgi:hypothetical protein
MVVWGGWAVSVVARAADSTYTGSFADGSYITGGQLHEWHDRGAQPKLNETNLFDSQRPIRWLKQDAAEMSARPTAFVELVGGDCLPGRVVGYSNGRRGAERVAPHVLVAPTVPLDFPAHRALDAVRVRAQDLRRVVWRRRGTDGYFPGTLFYTDGREARFRSVRWSDDAVIVLLADGPRRAAFNDIAELHLPRADNWNAYYTALAITNPACDDRLIQAETSDHLIVTTSLARFQPRSLGGEQRQWYHMFQPAWSLDPLWARHASIVWRRFWRPHEVPLSVLAPERVVERSMLAHGFHWRKNESVVGASLRSGDKLFGWGIGAQAACEWTIELPATVAAFHTGVGLDESAGVGGCARGLIYLNEAQGQPLFETKLLIGAGEVIDSGRLPLAGPASGEKRLLLVADPADKDRPSGADPFDIRDHVDWLEPTLELSPERLREEVERRMPGTIAAWDDWRAATTLPGVPNANDGEPLGETTTGAISGKVHFKLVSRWEGHDPLRGDFRQDVATEGNVLRLSREAKLTATQKYLAIQVSRQPGNSPSRIETRLNNVLLASFEAPESRPDDPADMRLIPLERFQGQTVNVEVRQIPQSTTSALEWRFLDFQEQVTPTPWRILNIRELASSKGSSLAKQRDGSILASDPNPKFDEYTVVAETDVRDITAFRLEALADPRLPQQGPGRGGDGSFSLSDFSVSVAPLLKPQEATSVVLASAAADFANQNSPVAALIDDDPRDTSWCVSQRPKQSHVAVLGTAADVGFPNGSRLTFKLSHLNHGHQNLGRFRLSATEAPRPVAVERPGIVLPIMHPGVRVIFQDDPDLIEKLHDGHARLETSDVSAGTSALRIDGHFRAPAWMSELVAQIRENPGPDEYRYLRFAWKKVEGQSICLGFARDGDWNAKGPHKYSYHAGPTAVDHDSLSLAATAPRDWTVVTRDLFADFGEFKLTGIGLGTPDGGYSLFDEILLGRTIEALDAAR